jgi:curved DNA-binding protein CbpA
MKPPAKDYYALLLVHPEAPVEIIRASYRTLMQQLKAHPDLGGDHAAAAAINAAYAVLKDPTQRAAYDAELAHRAAAGRATRASAPSADAYTDAYATEAPLDAQRAAAKGAAAAEGEMETCVFCGLVARWRPPTDAGAQLCARCASPLARAQLPERQDGDPKRALYRVGKHEPLRIYMDWQDRQGRSGNLLDVSLTGLRFSAAIDLEHGHKIRIDSSVCAAVARIAHRSPDTGDRGWQFGAEFLTVAFKRQRGSLLSVGA